jgi:hypothetical protein
MVVSVFLRYRGSHERSVLALGRCVVDWWDLETEVSSGGGTLCISVMAIDCFN